jgi:glutaredoxin
VTRDFDALEELVEVHRSRMTPTIVIGDRVVMGFDREQLDQLL